MGRRSRDVDLAALDNETAVEYTQRMRTHFRTKAEHNKRESTLSFWFLILAGAAVSFLLALGSSGVPTWMPLILSLGSTVASTWLHFRRPHQLWAIYRTAQRLVESHQVMASIRDRRIRHRKQRQTPRQERREYRIGCA
jgi:hypothetical protein